MDQKILAALQAALSEDDTDQLVFFVFDALFAGGEDLRGLPLSERKARLKALLGTDGTLFDLNVELSRRICAGEIDTAAPALIDHLWATTMAKLAARFYDPTEGGVLIDGHDLREVTIKSLRSQLGVVPQEPFLFAGSLRYNLAFANPDADDDERWEAIDAVGRRDVVERMPDGLETIVHERGQSLSSGERQLIALGRAFMAEPRVLVLDEATSNLDLKSETLVEGALDVLLEGRTAVLIAHRLSTIRGASRILVLADGRIVEQGSHDELIAAGGRYAALYRDWSKELAA